MNNQNSRTESPKLTRHEHALIKKHQKKQTRLSQYLTVIFTMGRGLGLGRKLNRAKYSGQTKLDKEHMLAKAEFKRDRRLQRNIMVEVLKSGNYNGV